MSFGLGAPKRSQTPLPFASAKARSPLLVSTPPRLKHKVISKEPNLLCNVGNSDTNRPQPTTPSAPPQQTQEVVGRGLRLGEKTTLSCHAPHLCCFQTKKHHVLNHLLLSVTGRVGRLDIHTPPSENRSGWKPPLCDFSKKKTHPRVPSNPPDPHGS